MNCPSEKILSSYLDEDITEIEREDIEEHLNICNKCLDMLLLASIAHKKYKRCPPSLLNKKIKEQIGLKTGNKKKELGWFLLTLFFFMMSFVVRKFFLQFLMASVILGFKWVMEGEGAKKVIMIFRGMERTEKKNERIESNRLVSSP